MGKYVCSICGYTHDEATGVTWEELDANWVCPLCKADKSAFKQEAAEQVVELAETTLELDEDMRELTTLEKSILCSNLARGCEKQYKNEEAELFTKLAEYFKSAAPNMQADYRALSILSKEDIQNNIVLANQIAKANGDRGAQRALVWDEKVTMILQSILSRYETEGEAMLRNTNVYVCTICGFIYIGNELPELCPVCKVPNWKFDKIEGGQ
ncbi:MAG: rubredoxin [Lachnospiraceae bacterium]